MPPQLPPGSPALLRRLNAAAVLHAIRTEGPLSRADLARATGLSKPTVKEVVEHLLGAGYVRETLPDDNGHPRRPGPRARLLSFRADLGHVLGIDIGADKTLALVTDLDGDVLAVERRRTTARERADAEAMLAKVQRVARAALAGAGVSLSDLKAVAVGTPGVVDPVSGTISLAPQLRGWEQIRLGRRLERFFRCPVQVENEVHLSLLAERWRGAAQGVDDALYVQLGVGIGGAILIGGEIYGGASGAAGEVGYLPLFEPEGPSDGLGPFEHAAGGTAFARLGRRAAEEDRGSLLLTLAGGRTEMIDAEIVFAASARTDRAATAVLERLLDRLARGIAAAVVVLDPATVIVGGGISRAGERLLAPLEERVRALVPVPPRIILSLLGEEAPALGAARLALQAVDEQLFAPAAMERP